MQTHKSVSDLASLKVRTEKIHFFFYIYILLISSLIYLSYDSALVWGNRNRLVFAHFTIESLWFIIRFWSFATQNLLLFIYLFRSKKNVRRYQIFHHPPLLVFYFDVIYSILPSINVAINVCITWLQWGALKMLVVEVFFSLSLSLSVSIDVLDLIPFGETEMYWIWITSTKY